MGLTADSRYRNCFYYFRGQAAEGVSRARIHERQFEDNSTKALVNVLEHGHLAADFVRSLVPNARQPTTNSTPEFYLQRGPALSSVSSPHLLGISVLGEIDTTTWSKLGEKGRIDAAICWSGEMTLLVETKVVERMAGAQLNRHALDWGISGAHEGAGSPEIPDTWTLTTWGDIYGWARDRSREYPDESAPGFLLGQLWRYLELTGLAPFSGFRNEHFEYFTLSLGARHESEYYETRSQIRARLGGVWEAIKERDRQLFDLVAPIHVNNLRANDTQASAQTNFGRREDVNLTVEVAAADLQLNLVGWTEPQRRKFELFFESEVGANALQEFAGYQLVIWSRNAIRDKAGNPYWMGAPATPFMTVSALELAERREELFDEFERSNDLTWKRPGYHLRRSWLRSQVVDRGDSFVDELVDEARRLIPLMLQVNSADEGGT